MKTNTDMNPIDRLNDDGQKDFPKSLVGKLKKRDDYRRFKYGAINSQQEVAREILQDIDMAIMAQKYNRMWMLTVLSTLIALISSITAIIAVTLS